MIKVVDCDSHMRNAVLSNKSAKHMLAVERHKALSGGVYNDAPAFAGHASDGVQCFMGRL
jgi:hypothetical protein